MARKIPEQSAGTVYRSLATTLQPPATLSAPAARIWREVVGCRPLGYYDAASLELVNLYSETMARAQAASAELRREPLGTKRFASMNRQNATLTTSVLRLAARLRLTPQARYAPRAAVHGEQGPGDLDPLIGGRAVPH